MLVKSYRRWSGYVLLFIVLATCIYTADQFRSRSLTRRSFARSVRTTSLPRTAEQALLSSSDGQRPLYDDDEDLDDIYDEEERVLAAASRVAADESPAEALDQDPKSPRVDNEAGSSVAPVQDEDEDADDETSPILSDLDYQELYSLTTRSRQFIGIFTGGDPIYNPNIIPHPTAHNLWVIMGQKEESAKHVDTSSQLICTAGMMNDVLVCTEPPVAVPIERSIPGHCEGDIAYFNFRAGPRDGRMFYGPEGPFVLYGSQSRYTCLGIWLHDARMLLHDFRFHRPLVKLFRAATEVQRPPPVKGIEKNFFMFWASDGTAYIHYDIFPKRVFAKLEYDGSAGADLAPVAAKSDVLCMTRFMPKLAPTEESIHQATNSLSITMCKRADPSCKPNKDNTFIATIFQHKSYHDFHGIYEPYLMLFRQEAPFAVHAISQRPLWITGRGPLTKETHSVLYENDPGRKIPANHTEMFYVTSFSWKTHGQRYHGYLDDPIFLAFGIEDSRGAVIDVLAEDLVGSLGLCSQ